MLLRSWAEDKAKRSREQAKVLDEARDHWKSQGIKIVVDHDLREEANVSVTWLSAGNKFSIQETTNRAQNLVDKLKPMTTNIKGRSKETIDRIIEEVLLLISRLKEWTSKAVEKVMPKFKT